jgi:hypothetical protein
VVWSNGCSTQFKCSRAWYYIARYPHLTICEPEGPKGVQMCWNYFAFGHCKGEVDGVGAFMRHKIHMEQINPQA